MDSREVGAGAGPKSGSRELKVIEPGPLNTSSPYVMAILRAENLFGLLRVAKLYRRIFQQVDILQ